ncbi:MAG: hypothetical protein HY897_12530 [Deltaproteobacteria bacterium]|nr:hypothetical protein [Deltaproteobacteria bacterium]
MKDTRKAVLWVLVVALGIGVAAYFGGCTKADEDADGGGGGGGGEDGGGGGGGECGGEVDCNATCLKDQECDPEGFDMDKCVAECGDMVPKLVGSYVEGILACYEEPTCEETDACAEALTCPATAESDAYVDTICAKSVECNPEYTVEQCKADMAENSEQDMMSCICPDTLTELNDCIAAVDCADMDTGIDDCHAQVFPSEGGGSE